MPAGTGSARHLAFFVALAVESTPKQDGPEQGAWLARLDLERENLAAHAWWMHTEDGSDLGLRLVDALQLYWSRRGLLELGWLVTTDALARAGAPVRSRDRGSVLFAAGNLGNVMGRRAEAQTYLEECLSIARELGDKKVAAATLMLLGAVSLGQDNRSTARIQLTESIALARELGSKPTLSAAQ